jgi:hypothetical protein
MKQAAAFLLARSLGGCASTAVLSAVLSLTSPHTARAAGVVGNGTPASCTKDTLIAALAGAGSRPIVGLCVMSRPTAAPVASP